MADDEAADGGGGCSSSSSEGGGGGVEEVGPPSSSESSSPKDKEDKVKFLCSYGGKILPRPVDGLLKYVGGETRVIAVSGDITLSELMKKMSVEFGEDMILKYQVMPEDLEVLVTVRTDEDLRHMLEEYDRPGSEGNPKLRSFLFPSTHLVVENQATTTPTPLLDPHALEQRYIEAINGTIHTTTTFRLPRITARHPSFSLSACSSPKSTSPESNKVDSIPRDPTTTTTTTTAAAAAAAPLLINGHHNSRLSVQRVRSSPNLCCLNISPHQSMNLGNQHLYQQHHHYYQHHQQHHLPAAGYHHPTSRLPHDPHRLASTLSLARSDFARAPIPHAQNQSYVSIRHNTMGSGNYVYGHHDQEHSGYVYRTIDRSVSVPQSPRSRILE